MPAQVSVVIPALDEEACIAAAIDSAFAAGAAEVIVADGGSSDATVPIAQAHGARVVEGERVRARQLNRGAEAAAHDALIFLHADSLLPDGSAEAVVRALEEGFVFGGFRARFIEGDPRLACVAFMINARTRITRAPWGDQAQFTSRAAFLRAGGYREMPIMEDYELAARMRRTGRTVLLPLTVRTSGRRFLRKGVIVTSVLNWLIIAAFHAGVSPERLARWYR
ncbi:MAG TPA: TIGR04283 family arsenosugar biosynthesis glycosyltransferase [Thermoanaerobaculia bacterium]|nr:TIGR04283 family arsenosugar biosynthesis glycosyltransferase [Thermoanaerobaculia bacterium]